MYISKPHTAFMFDRRDDENSGSKRLFAIQAQDAALRKQQKYQRDNLCPNCHFVLPTSGICDCGYVKNK